MDNNELMHHGVVGMKWGVRRYQNKDGSLTAAGKKRYEKEMAKLREEEKSIKAREQTKAKLDKLESKRKELDERKQALESNKSRRSKKEKPAIQTKSVKDMSDQELQSVVNRMNLEARYKQLNPEKVSVGRRFLSKIGKDVMAPALTEVAKNSLKDFLNSEIKKTATKNK